MLVIAIKSISLGKFSKANRDSEVCVRVQCGNFHTRTSYMRENAGTVNINERLTIDMDNHPKQEVSIYVDVIDKNDLDQIEKDKWDADTIGSVDLNKSYWSNKSKTWKIALRDEGKETDININADAYAINDFPSKGN